MTYPVRQFPNQRIRRPSLQRLLVATWLTCTLISDATADAVIDSCTRSELAAAVAEGGLVTYAQPCTISVNSPIVVTDTVTIDGGSFSNVLSGGNSSRVFTVEPGGSLTLLNMRLLNGKASSGGAIYVKVGGTLVVSNCVFQGNAATGTNGAAGSAGADKSGTGDNGKAGADGGSGMGGAIYNAGVCNAYATQFITNSATGGTGGAGGAGGDGNFKGGNGADGGNGGSVLGGAICNIGTLAVRDCTFEGNSITAGNAGAGGAAGTGGVAGLPGSGGAGGSALGAGVYSTKAATILQSTFSANVAKAGNSTAGGTYSNDNGIPGEPGGNAAGGALYIANGAAMTNLTVYGNRVSGGTGGNGGPGQFYGGNGGNGGSGSGGGIYNFGTLHVVNCTIAQNQAIGGTNGLAGSGNFAAAPGTPGVTQGAGVMAGTACYLQNTILANNTGGGNGAGTIADRGYNLSSDLSLTFSNTNSRSATNPRLNALANNGGWTRTMSLQTNSPALNKIPASTSPKRDQRGANRPIDNLADIGAYESGFRLSGSISTITNLLPVPLPAVSVSAGGFSTVTDNAGKYELYVASGPAVISPELEGFFFTPAERSVEVAADTANLNFSAATGFWISGSVVEFTNSLSNVTIKVGTNIVATDTHGAFTAYVLPGTYAVTPQPGCYSFNPPSRTVTVGPDISGVNFIAAAQAGTISGFITGANGAGIEGVSVKVGSTNVLTDESGFYSSPSLCAGTYEIRPTLAGYGFSPAASTISVPPDGLNVNFSGYPVFTVSGEVKMAGVPLPNVAVTLGTNTVMTDTNGFYSHSAPAGVYPLSPALDCHNFFPTNVSALVTNNTAVDFIAQLDANWITGTVLEGTNPIAGASVVIGSNVVATASDGTFAQSNLCAGTYLVTATKSGYSFEPVKIPVALGPGTSGTNIVFEAFTLYSISGRVLVGTNPLANFKVQAGSNTVSGANGDYLITGLRPGTYTVVPTSDCYSFAPVRDVTVGPSVTNADFAATRYNLAISGTVYHQNGQPVNGAAVSFAGVTFGTDSQGYFILPGLCPATNTLIVSYPGLDFSRQRVELQNTSISGLTATGYVTLTLSGKVLEGAHGVPGVNLTAESALDLKTNTTSANGSYMLTLRSNVAYTITPGLGDFAFIPSSILVMLQTNTAGSNFFAHPVLSIQEGTNWLMQLRFTGSPGVSYRIQATTNFADWSNISTNLSPILFSDPASTNQPLRMYRLLRP